MQICISVETGRSSGLSLTLVGLPMFCTVAFEFNDSFRQESQQRKLQPIFTAFPIGLNVGDKSPTSRHLFRSAKLQKFLGI